MTATLIVLMLSACGSSSEPTTPPVATPQEITASAAQPASSKAPQAQPPPEDDRPLQADVAEGRKLLESGDAEGAIKALDAAVQARPGDPDAWYWRGRARARLDDRPTATADLRQAVALAPDFTSAQRHLAFQLVQAHHCDQAMEHLDRVVSLAPDEPTGWYNRGFCRYFLDDYDGAVSDAQRACELGYPLACSRVKKMERRRKFKEIAAQREAEKAAAATQPPAQPPSGQPTTTKPATTEPTASVPTASEPTASEPTASVPTASVPPTEVNDEP